MLYLIGIFTLILSWSICLANWRLGALLGLIYTSLGGYLILLSNNSPIIVLAKDFLFFIPCYLSFTLWVKSSYIRTPNPKLLTSLITTFFLIVLYQIFNPFGPSLTPSLIGIRVWLFYIPFFFIGFHFFNNIASLKKFLFVILLASIIPLTVGLVQLICSHIFGYEQTMGFFYPNAVLSNNNHTFRVVNFGIKLFSIQSTFSFRSQYSLYLYVIICIGLFLSLIHI